MPNVDGPIISELAKVRGAVDVDGTRKLLEQIHRELLTKRAPHALLDHQIRTQRRELFEDAGETL